MRSHRKSSCRRSVSSRLSALARLVRTARNAGVAEATPLAPSRGVSPPDAPSGTLTRTLALIPDSRVPSTPKTALGPGRVETRRKGSSQALWGELRGADLLDRVADLVREADWRLLRVRVVVMVGAATRHRTAIQHYHVSHLADTFPNVLMAVVAHNARHRKLAHRWAPRNGRGGAAPVLDTLTLPDREAYAMDVGPA